MFILGIRKHMVVMTTLLIAATSTPALSQKQINEQNLTYKVGDTVKNLSFKNLIFNESRSAKLKTFPTELVIIDFWDTWCQPCVAALPHNQKLEEQFKGKLKFIGVTRSSEKIINSFLRERNLPITTETDDTTLVKQFPHSTVPHYIWIKNSVVIAITNQKEATSENVQNALKGDYSMIRPKGDVQILRDYNYSTAIHPDFKNNRGVKELSYLAEHDPRLVSFILSKENRILALAANPVSLYRFAYNKPDNFGEQVPLNLTRIEALTQIKGKDQYSGTYDYYLVTKIDENSTEKKLLEEKIEMMKNDLDRYFNLSANWEPTKTSCYVLYTIDSTKSKSKISSIGYDFTKKTILAKTMSSLTLILNRSHLENPFPTVDETGIAGPVDILFDVDSKNYKELRSELLKFGIGIKVEERIIDILKIREKQSLTALTK